MAAGTSLVIQYQTGAGGSTTHTWRYAKPGATAANVKSVITSTISNGAIFSNVPTAVKQAKMVTTTETVYDLDTVMNSQQNGDPDLRNLISLQPIEPDDDDNPRNEVTETIYRR